MVAERERQERQEEELRQKEEQGEPQEQSSEEQPNREVLEEMEQSTEIERDPKSQEETATNPSAQETVCESQESIPQESVEEPKEMVSEPAKEVSASASGRSSSVKRKQSRPSKKEIVTAHSLKQVKVEVLYTLWMITTGSPLNLSESDIAKMFLHLLDYTMELRSPRLCTGPIVTFLKKNLLSELCRLIKPICHSVRSLALSAVVVNGAENRAFIKVYAHLVDNTFNFARHLIAVVEQQPDSSKVASILDMWLIDHFEMFSDSCKHLYITLDAGNTSLSDIFAKSVFVPIALPCNATKLEKLVRSVINDNQEAFGVINKLQIFLLAVKANQELVDELSPSMNQISGNVWHFFSL